MQTTKVWSPTPHMVNRQDPWSFPGPKPKANKQQKNYLLNVSLGEEVLVFGVFCFCFFFWYFGGLFIGPYPPTQDWSRLISDSFRCKYLGTVYDSRDQTQGSWGKASIFHPALCLQLQVLHSEFTPRWSKESNRAKCASGKSPKLYNLSSTDKKF